MELRNLAVLFGLCLLAVMQCSEAHTIERRDANDEDIFAADEASDDGTQNDDDNDGGNSEAKDQPMPQAVILTQPIHYKINLGEDVKLECKVDPDNDTVVQWHKGNMPVLMGTMNMASEPRYSTVPESNDMLITNVKESDGDTYRCELMQDNPLLVEHTLTVLTPPTITSFTATNDGNLIEGENLLLTCEVRSRPAATIIWARSGEDGVQNHNLQKSDGEFLANGFSITNVKREHSGKYYCYAFNSVGQNQSELQVNVAGKPKVHVHKTVVNSAVNVEAVLQCTAHYEANPHIRWYKDGGLIADSSTKYTVSTDGPHSNLTVTPSADSDFGTYTCEASNSIGKHNRSIELVQRPVVEDLNAEEHGRLSWVIHSHQPLQDIRVQVHPEGEHADEWKEFEVPVPHSLRHEYEVAFELGEKIPPGKYRALVKAKNDHSWSDNVQEVPFEIEIQPQSIQHASVFGSDAPAFRPSSIISSTMLMYVLVRLL